MDVSPTLMCCCVPFKAGTAARCATRCLSFIAWLLVPVFPSIGQPHVESSNGDIAFTDLKDVFQISSWSVDDGLPSNKIECLKQTRDGYLWIGTPNGLVRFDGLRFRVFDSTNTEAFRLSDDCLSLAEDAEGILHVGTHEGLVILEHGEFRHAAPDVSGFHVWDLHALSSGGVLAATDAGAWRYSGGRFDRVFPELREDDGLGSRSEDFATTAVHETDDGVLWIGSTGGLYFRRPTEDHYTKPSGFHMQGLHHSFRGFAMDAEGMLWWADQGEFRRFEPGGALSGSVAVPEAIRVGGMEPLLSDTRGRLWFRGASGGIVSWNGFGFEVYPAGTGLMGDRVSCMESDLEGNLWVGTQQGGLNRLKARKLRVFTMENGLPSADIWSVSQAPDGGMWVASNQGLSRMDGFGRGVVNYAPVYPEGHGIFFERGRMRVVLADRAGNIWSANRYGVFRFEGDQLRLQEFPWRGHETKVRVLYEQFDGSMLVGTQRGLHVIAEGRTRPLHSDVLGRSHLRGVMEDREGSLWVSTHQGELFRFNGENTERFDQAHGLPEEPFWPIHIDEKGAVWIGSEVGLLRFYEREAQSFSRLHGLHENTVLNLLVDEQQRWWLNGYRGIQLVEEHMMQDLAEGRLEQITPMVLDTDDGMLNAEGNGEWLPNSCRDENGRMWFPTVDGLVMIDPDSIEEAPIPPPVVVDRVVASGRVVFQDGAVVGPGHVVHGPPDAQERSPVGRGDDVRLRFPPGTADLLEIHYTANCLSAPTNVRFRYRLEGYETEWRQGDGYGRAAYYTNLEPGIYRFRVSASNDDGVWNEPGAFLAFAVEPHFHQTLVFRILGGGIVLIIGGCLVAWRIERLRGDLRARHERVMENQRARIATDLHDKLGADLTNIALLGEVIRQQPDDSQSTRDRSARIATIARDAVDSMSELVWLTNPRNDTLSSLVTYLRETAAEALDASGIELRLEFPDKVPERVVSGELRRNLVLVVKEALRNVIRHSEARRTTVSLGILGNRLVLSVEDDGRGLVDQVSWRGGNGLANMEERVSRHGGRMVAATSSSGRTRIEFEVPL